MKATLLIFVSFIALQFFAQETKQDTLWFLNGNTKLISEYRYSDDGTIFYYKNKKGKIKEVDTFFLFSINKADGTKKIIYNPETEENKDSFTIEQMESFVRGGHQANKEYKARLAFFEGLLVGAASPYIISSSWFIGALSENPFYSILLPATNSAIIGLTKPSERKIIKNHPQEANNEYFLNGYKEAAKRKRVKKSILGGAIGLAGGLITFFVTR